MIATSPPLLRPPPIVVISDCHLGTGASRAESLLAYLEGIDPEILVINGDLCDLGMYWRNHWPPLHREILSRILRFAAEGVQVHYVIGNHDAPIRRFAGMLFDGLHVTDRLHLDLESGRTLIVHGDCLDEQLSSRGLTWRLAGWGYDKLINFATDMDRIRAICGLHPWSLATAIKARLPGARRYIERFEQAAAEFAAREGFSTVICGHIHHPGSRVVQTIHGPVTYHNTGDWVEHCSALEWDGHSWAQANVPLALPVTAIPNDRPRNTTAEIRENVGPSGSRRFEAATLVPG